MCQEAGFDDYFVQPLTVDDIFQKVLTKMFYLHQIIVNEHMTQLAENNSMDDQKIENQKIRGNVSGIKEILSRRFDVIEEEANEDEDQSHTRQFLL